jgi:tetratricopeptide (TPR) repeat protein
MKKSRLFIILLLVITCAQAQPQDSKQLQETANQFLRQQDYANAVLVLNRALQQDPNNTSISKDLALGYFLQRNYSQALETIKPLLDRDDADDQCYQIAGSIYKELNMAKDGEKMYRKGIKKFPDSGPLYNELGELLRDLRDADAISQWEKGITADPAYPKNYFNAAKYYHATGNMSWTLIYAEIFINMEPFGNRTAEMKDMLLEDYKKLFENAEVTQKQLSKSSFSKAFLATMNKQTTVANQGINTETLTMIRTRFILDWDHAGLPYKLFQYQQQLLREGLFDAYNQWIFGSSQNLAAFQNWTVAHSEEYSRFTSFQKGRVFKMPKKPVYH